MKLYVILGLSILASAPVLFSVAASASTVLDCVDTTSKSTMLVTINGDSASVTFSDAEGTDKGTLLASSSDGMADFELDPLASDTCGRGPSLRLDQGLLQDPPSGSAATLTLEGNFACAEDMRAFTCTRK